LLVTRRPGSYKTVVQLAVEKTKIQPSSLKLIITNLHRFIHTLIYLHLPSFCTSLYLLFSGHARMRITEKKNLKKIHKTDQSGPTNRQVFMYRCNITKEHDNKSRTEAIALYVPLLSITSEVWGRGWLACMHGL
jgi:hypothetical protein